MAQELDDGEFWLPSEFLTDEDLLMDFKTDYSKSKRADDFSLGFGSFSGFNSDLSSPVESVMGSTETESDEDEFISGLTRKMAHSTINDVSLSKGLKLSGSPQSTLCGFKPGSNQSSPNSGSRVSSPTELKETVGWDLLYAAAGEVARMRMNEETAPFRNTNLFAPPQNTIEPSPIKKPNPPSAYYPAHTQTEAHLAFLQLQASHYQRMKQQQMIKSGVWGQRKMEFHHQYLNCVKPNGQIGRAQGLSTATWPTLQQSQQQKQQAGSGMRALFLGETPAKKERTGTGVFLPRRLGSNPVDNRKKPGCSTVLLPDRVVHALNLNLDSVDSQTHFRLDAGLSQRSNAMYSHQRRSQIPQPAMNQELRLPQEWTY